MTEGFLASNRLGDYAVIKLVYGRSKVLMSRMVSIFIIWLKHGGMNVVAQMLMNMFLQ
jgi:hypothetical protein